MDLKYNHQTIIYVVNSCHNDDATDLIALGGSTLSRSLATFHIGSRITAIAWSPNTISPSHSDKWILELAVASADYGLHLLTKGPEDEQMPFHFGGGLSGHHGKITDITFCGGRGPEAARYVATVSDDKMLMVWDLYPPSDEPIETDNLSPPPRPQPTAYAIPFPHPLTSINSHPSSSKEFLVSDCRGSLFLTDWRSDPDDPEQGPWHHLVELVEPYALAEASRERATQCFGSVAWQRESADIIGAVYGSKFSLWDISKLQGGKPFISGNSFVEGGNRFRWCYTYPEYFAISTQSPSKGAVVHVHNVNYIHSQPSVFPVAPRPHLIRDFDFVSVPGIPRLAVAFAKTISVFRIGVDS
ncbi:hypothetical protein BDZ89DRAFT_1057233 [Hymenopellis radicata]|nr:hypothetical protein BDZ89DRAFT_1057233 [Hymenopellis radicata]